MTNNEIEALLGTLTSESYEEMQELMVYIDTTCLSCEVLMCEELFRFLGQQCPASLIGYGWRYPLQLRGKGKFYIYMVRTEYVDQCLWGLKCPEPEEIA